MNFLRNICVCIGVLSCICMGTLTVQAAEAEKPRSTTLETLNMDALQKVLDSHKGKFVIVNFFATWCPPCREEIPGLVSIAEKRKNDVVIIGLSSDESQRPLPDFIKKLKINYPVYMADISLLLKFNVQSIPHNLVYDTTGKLVGNAAGFVTEKELNTFINAFSEQKQ